MDLKTILTEYNKRLGNIVPGLENSLVDIASLSDIIDTTKEISFKLNLYPEEDIKFLIDYTDEKQSEQIDALNEYINSKVRQMIFIPKINISFEIIIDMPIFNTNLLNISDDVKSEFEIPITVIFYYYIGNKLFTETRYFNSDYICDETAYMNIPQFILNYYDFNDKFAPTLNAEMDESFFTYGRTFDDSQFKFYITDPVIKSNSRNIPFFEIIFSKESLLIPQKLIHQYQIDPKKQWIHDAQGYLIYKKDNNATQLYPLKLNRLYYRKIFYNVDYINFKNRIIKL